MLAFLSPDISLIIQLLWITCQLFYQGNGLYFSASPNASNSDTFQRVQFIEQTYDDVSYTRNQLRVPKHVILLTYKLLLLRVSALLFCAIIRECLIVTVNFQHI